VPRHPSYLLDETFKNDFPFAVIESNKKKKKKKKKARRRKRRLWWYSSRVLVVENCGNKLFHSFS